MKPKTQKYRKPESLGWLQGAKAEATSTGHEGGSCACSLLCFLEEVAAELQNERQLRQRCFSSTVLISTSNILSDIQEHTYLQMKGVSYAADSHRRLPPLRGIRDM